LKVIAAHLDIERRKKRPVQQIKAINFVRAGEMGKATKTTSGILATANDWNMQADVNQKLKFPPEITTTNQRPDIVLWSKNTKQAVLIELTVPWEERIQDANERKRTKYQQLVEECRENGWKTSCYPIEVGCRGFAGQSLWQALRSLGVTGKTRSKLISDVMREAERASQWVWQKREEQWKG
jgi:hypothetical protein